MLVLLNHLFPTGIAFLLFLQLALYFSSGALLIFLFAAILGGVIVASEIMSSDNLQLARLRGAVRQLKVTEYLEDDLVEHLSPAARNYAERRLGKAWRIPHLLFVHLDDGRIMDGARAFGFTRFIPICIHSLGSLEASGRRPNMIHHHEFGHLFVFQPRGGMLSLGLGTAVPLIYLLSTSEDQTSSLWILLVTGLLLHAAVIFLLNDAQGEMQSDGFALACEFTKAWENMSPEEQAAALEHGVLFQERPPVIAAYARLLEEQHHSAAGRKKPGRLRRLKAVLERKLRVRSFESAYRRLNSLGRLNRQYFRIDRKARHQDSYWKEVFFRRVLQSLFLAPRTQLLTASFVANAIVFLSVGPVMLGQGFGLVLVSTAAAALVLLALSAAVLDEDSSMVAQACMRMGTSLNVLESGVSLNRREKQEEEAYANWLVEGGSVEGLPGVRALPRKTWREHMVERWLFGKDEPCRVSRRP